MGTGDPEAERLHWSRQAGESSSVPPFKRETPSDRMPRTYTTLMPRYWQTITWLWDYQLASIAQVSTQILSPVENLLLICSLVYDSAVRVPVRWVCDCWFSYNNSWR